MRLGIREKFDLRAKFNEPRFRVTSMASGLHCEGLNVKCDLCPSPPNGTAISDVHKKESG